MRPKNRGSKFALIRALGAPLMPWEHSAVILRRLCWLPRSLFGIITRRKFFQNLGFQRPSPNRATQPDPGSRFEFPAGFYMDLSFSNRKFTQPRLQIARVLVLHSHCQQHQGEMHDTRTLRSDWQGAVTTPPGCVPSAQSTLTEVRTTGAACHRRYCN